MAGYIIDTGHDPGCPLDKCRRDNADDDICTDNGGSQKWHNKCEWNGNSAWWRGGKTHVVGHNGDSAEGIDYDHDYSGVDFWKFTGHHIGDARQEVTVSTSIYKQNINNINTYLQFLTNNVIYKKQQFNLKKNICSEMF